MSVSVQASPHPGPRGCLAAPPPARTAAAPLPLGQPPPQPGKQVGTPPPQIQDPHPEIWGLHPEIGSRDLEAQAWEPDLGLGPQDLEPEHQYLGLKSQHQSLGPQDLEPEPQEWEYGPQDLEPEPQDLASKTPDLELNSEFCAWDLEIWDWILISIQWNPLFGTPTLRL